MKFPGYPSNRDADEQVQPLRKREGPARVKLSRETCQARYFLGMEEALLITAGRSVLSCTRPSRRFFE